MKNEGTRISNELAGWKNIKERVSVCIEMMMPEFGILQRIEKLSEAGFKYFEFWCWKNKDLERIESVCRKTGMQVCAFSGDDEYSMTEPAENREYIDFLEQSMQKAKRLGCPRLVIHSDQLLPDGSARKSWAGGNRKANRDSMLSVLEKAAKLAERYGIDLMLEPLNTVVDHPDYFLNDSQTAFGLTERVGSTHIKVLYDTYHMHLMGEDVSRNIEQNVHEIGHMHFAGVPGRHEPDTGDLDIQGVIRQAWLSGYDGYFGFEYEQNIKTKRSLETIKALFDFSY